MEAGQISIGFQRRHHPDIRYERDGRTFYDHPAMLSGQAKIL
jgi:hypothetical protein